jgi:hypothetical protein
MSLLDSGTITVVVYPTVGGIDGDGNPVQRPSASGYPARATVQPLSSTETAELGVQTGEVYRLRFVRSDEKLLQPGAQILWLGHRWSVDGYPEHHTGSPSTAHLTYRIRRS